MTKYISNQALTQIIKELDNNKGRHSGDGGTIVPNMGLK